MWLKVADLGVLGGLVAQGGRLDGVSGPMAPLLGISNTSFPGGSEGKAFACNAGDLGLIPGSGRSPWRRKWQSTPVLLPGKSHGHRSLVGYSLWGRKESDTTE